MENNSIEIDKSIAVLIRHVKLNTEECPKGKIESIASDIKYLKKISDKPAVIEQLMIAFDLSENEAVECYNAA